MFQLTLQNHDKSVIISKSVLAENQDTSYCILDGLTIVEGNFTASVKAVNKMYLRSTPVTNDISVSPMLPRLTGKYLVVCIYADLFSFVCCALFVVVLSCVSNVVCVSGLSIIDCPFGYSYMLQRIGRFD